MRKKSDSIDCKNKSTLKKTIFSFFSNLKDFLILIWSSTVEWAHSSKSSYTYIFKSKKNIALFPLSLVLAMIIPFSAIVFSSFLPNNLQFVLKETYDEYRLSENSSPNTLLYYESIDNRDNLSFSNPELCKEARELATSAKIIQVYQSNWLNKYSPICIDINGTMQELSVLLLPKEKYIYQTWQENYEIPLLCPKGSNYLPRNSAPSDIYITKEYADYLINQQGLNEGDYQSLIDTTLNSSYRWNKVYTKTELIIKGILDSSSSQYLAHKSKFGDFFVANDYFSLPIPSFVYFEESEVNKVLSTFGTILKLFDYKATRNNYSSIYSGYVFQSRVAFFGEYESDLSIKTIFEQSNTYNVRINKAFEVFSSKRHIVFLIIFSLINAASTLGLIFALNQVLRIAYTNGLDNKKRTSLYLTLPMVFTYIVGVFLTTILFNKFKFVSMLSYNNYIGVILYILELLLIFLYITIKKRK